jgi:regulator of protease activity HflC (stomatin/prohibitin superfamily)
MKNSVLKNIWSATIGAFVFVSIIFALIVGIWANFLTSLIAMTLLFTLLCGVLMVQAIVSVPERYNYILTYFGKYHKTLKPGLNLVYPWFNVFNIPIAYNVSEHSIDIFEKTNDQSELVEFKESSAWVMFSARLKVVDTEKAFTNVDDVYKEIRDILKKRFRSYAEDVELFTFANDDSDDDVDLKELFGDYENEPDNIINHIEDEWGVKLLAVRLEDIILTEADKKAREEVYLERNRLAVIDLQNKQTIAKAKAEAKKITTIAKATQTAQELEGTGLKSALEQIIQSNLSPEEASRFLQAMKKWEAVPQVQTAFFSDNNKSAGAGMDKQTIAEIIAIAHEIKK